MDDIDRRILCELQQNARITNTELAKRVGLSPTPCWNRVRHLEETGVIEKYEAILNNAALGAPDTVIIAARLDRHDADVLRQFEDALKQQPDVIEAYFVGGEYDYIIKVATSGARGYEKLIREKLYRMPGLSHTSSHFVLHCLKRTFSVSPLTVAAPDPSRLRQRFTDVIDSRNAERRR